MSGRMSTVERILEAGRTAFPEIAIAPDVLAPLIEQRLEDEDAELVADEVYLACACALADRAALATFERRYFSAIPAALSRLALERDDVTDIEQQLRIRLFVTEDDGVARVVAYAGLGQLGGLVRVAAVRAGLNVLRARGRIADGSGDGLEDFPSAGDDPALARLKAQHRSEFKAAFEESIAALDPRERTILQLAIVKGVGIDKLGAIYGVHRATAARWIASARDRLARGVHRALGARLGVAKTELADLLPLVESQLELSLERLLRSRA
jgi:RNA polymerase sigma-70 factor (ECF subfamily)